MKTLFFEEALATPKARLTVKLDVGKLRVQTHDKPLILIEAKVKKAKVEVSRDGDDVTVVARIKRNLGWLNLFGANARSELTITVPTECALHLKTATGSVAVQEVAAPVTTKTATGSVHLTNLSGPVTAKVVTGKLVYDGQLSAADHQLKVITGSIHLALAGEPDLELKANTITGSIRCDFPLQQEKRRRQFAQSSLRGVLGSGAGTLALSAVTGSITIEDRRKMKDEVRITKEKVFA